MSTLYACRSPLSKSAMCMLKLRSLAGTGKIVRDIRVFGISVLLVMSIDQMFMGVRWTFNA